MSEKRINAQQLIKTLYEYRKESGQDARVDVIFNNDIDMSIPSLLGMLYSNFISFRDYDVSKWLSTSDHIVIFASDKVI